MSNRSLSRSTSTQIHFKIREAELHSQKGIPERFAYKTKQILFLNQLKETKKMIVNIKEQHKLKLDFLKNKIEQIKGNNLIN